MGDWIWVLITGLITFLAVSMIGGNPLIETEPIPFKMITDREAQISQSPITAATQPTLGSESLGAIEGSGQQIATVTDVISQQFQNNSVEIWFPLLIITLLILGWRITQAARASVQEPPTPKHASS
jgi:hypothetical protein